VYAPDSVMCMFVFTTPNFVSGVTCKDVFRLRNLRFGRRNLQLIKGRAPLGSLESKSPKSRTKQFVECRLHEIGSHLLQMYADKFVT